MFEGVVLAQEYRSAMEREAAVRNSPWWNYPEFSRYTENGTLGSVPNAPHGLRRSRAIGGGEVRKLPRVFALYREWNLRFHSPVRSYGATRRS